MPAQNVGYQQLQSREYTDCRGGLKAVANQLKSSIQCIVGHGLCGSAHMTKASAAEEYLKTVESKSTMSIIDNVDGKAEEP